MMCFKDMTFCTAECDNHKCSYKLTPDVISSAQVWWGGGDAPIAVADRSDGCAAFVPVYPDYLEMDGEA